MYIYMYMLLHFIKWNKVEKSKQQIFFIDRYRLDEHFACTFHSVLISTFGPEK